MIATIKSQQNSAKIRHSDWDFLPKMLSGTAGMIIGWAIALILGWV